VDGPRPGLLGARCEVGLQAEGGEADAGELVQPRLVLAGLGEHLAGLVLLQLHEFGLELGVHEDRLGRRDQGGQLGPQGVVGEAGVVGVEDEDEGL